MKIRFSSTLTTSYRQLCLRIKIVMGWKDTSRGFPVKQRLESSGQAPQESSSLEMAQQYASQLKDRRKTKTMQTQMTNQQASEEADRQINTFLKKPKSIVGKSLKLFHDPFMYPDHTKFSHLHPDLSFVALWYSVSWLSPFQVNVRHLIWRTWHQNTKTNWEYPKSMRARLFDRRCVEKLSHWMTLILPPDKILKQERYYDLLKILFGPIHTTNLSSLRNL